MSNFVLTLIVRGYLKFNAQRWRNVGSAKGYKLTIDAIVSC
jgi:hypothetical protein